MPPSVVSKRNNFRKFLPSKRSRFTTGSVTLHVGRFNHLFLLQSICLLPLSLEIWLWRQITLHRPQTSWSTPSVRAWFWVVGGSRKPFRGCAPILLTNRHLPGLPCGRSDLKPNICPFQRGLSWTLQLVVAQYAQIFRPETFFPADWMGRNYFALFLGTCKDRGETKMKRSNSIIVATEIIFFLTEMAVVSTSVNMCTFFSAV